MFKVGDKVRITGDGSDSTDHLDGEIGTIVAVGNNDCLVSVPYDDLCWWIWNYNMTPVSDVNV